MNTPQKSEAPRTAIQGASEPTKPQLATEKGSTTIMAETTHPVDSTTRTCCGGIGAHMPDRPPALRIFDTGPVIDPYAITICEEGGEKIEVICAPFEDHLPDYQGEQFLAIFYNGEEEGFVVLNSDQAGQLARLLLAGGGAK